jgi:putative transposase
MSRSHPWEVSDALWERVIPLIPPPHRIREEGVLACRIGKHVPLVSMCYELVSGWNALPRALGASSTVHDR